MNALSSCIRVCLVIALGGPIARCAEIALVPVSASGSHDISGNAVVLDGGGQRVFLEVHVSDWDPDGDGTPAIRGFQATLDPSGFTSGLVGVLEPANEPCSADAECTASLGVGATCTFPLANPTLCTPAFIDTSRSNYLFDCCTHFPVVDLSTTSIRFGAATLIGAAADPGIEQYMGTLVVDVPTGALGTFTIAFKVFPDTNLQDQNLAFIEPLTLIPALITIACAVDDECDDNNECTQDSCLGDGTCLNLPNYDEATFCCNPTTGTLLAIDDGNECTDDSCDSTTGIVLHDVRFGEICGDSFQTDCDDPDTCDQDAVCQRNYQPVGTGCGDDTDTECTAPDTCDGAGTCELNHVLAGSLCGDGSDTDCTDPDTCDGLGTCQTNDAADDTSCNELFCALNQACSAGSCAGGSANDCDDGLSCTSDTCDENGDQCVNTLDPTTCLIENICRTSGELNPENDCQACDPALDDLAWSFRENGAECDDGDPCTGTGRPEIGVDTCDGAGSCSGLPDVDCNDNCEFAVEIFEGVNTGANVNQGPDDVEVSCQTDSNNDVWFVYTASCDGDVFASTTGSNFTPSNDPVLSVHDACPGDGGNEFACDDDSGAGLQAALTFAGEVGVSYWFRVAGFEQNTGDIVLNVSTINDCLIDDVCHTDGALNPLNDCEACVPELSTTSWSFRPEGTACGSDTDTQCDSPDACDGAGLCESNPKPDGTPCTDEGNECTFDECSAGECTHPPVPSETACGDPSDSQCDHPDTCDGNGSCLVNFESFESPCGEASSDQCDNPDICDGDGACDNNHVASGTPCDDTDVCTGPDVCETGSCVGPFIPVTPTVVGVGQRYVSVTPQPTGSAAPVALRVTSPTWECLDVFVGVDGRLVNNPVAQLPADWGTVLLHGEEITPSAVYVVEADCGGILTEPGSDSTPLWGDTIGAFDGQVWTPPDGKVGILDITAIVEGFVGAETAPDLQRVDVWECIPDGAIDILDILFGVQAFNGVPFPCPPPCVP